MNRILWDVEIELFKTHITRTVVKNRDRWDRWVFIVKKKVKQPLYRP